MNTEHPQIEQLEKHLGTTFNDENVLWQAVTHRSYLNENKDWKLDHNERLEFLGDAVLELVVTDHLYHHYNLPEGELTNLRSAIVRGEMLSKIAEEMNIDDFMLMSKGERKDTGKARQYILANAVEAVIGAVYLDQGYDAAKKIIDTYVISKLDYVVSEGLHIDNKSRFQEIAQEKFRVTPTYKVLSEVGLDHNKQFVVGAYLHDEKFGEGEGSSKQEAQQKAAKEALKTIEEGKQL